MPLTHVIADLVRQQTTTTGTGTLSLGTVPSGCRGVVVGIGNGKKARYKLSASDGGWEIGLGTVTDASPDTFSRDVVYASSAGGTTKITLPTGTHTLDVTLDAKSANEMTPRLLNIGNGVTLSSGTLTVDCMGSCDALAVVVLTSNVTTVVMSNLPERAAVEMWVTHSGGPWTFPQNAWPAGTTLHGSYNLYIDGTVTRFWWTTTDAGATSILESNAPFSISRTPTITAGAITVDAAWISEVVVNLTLTGDITTINRQNIPTNCRIRYEITQGAGGPWVIKDSAWGSGAIVPFYITAATGKTVITWTTTDGGATATVEGSVNSAGAIKMPAARYVDTSVLAVGLSTVAGAAGRIDVARFVPEYDMTVDRLGVYVTTGVAAATGRVVIYGANANNEPDARLFFPADDLNLATSAVLVEHTASFIFRKGVLYYVGFLHGSTATIHGIQGYTLPSMGFAGPTSSSPGSVIRQTVTYPAAPANFGFIASQITASAAPSIKMRMA